MKYLLDTNVCIRFLNGRSPAIKHHMAAVQAEDIALPHDLILVTHNTREFSRVPNLQIADWESDD